MMDEQRRLRAVVVDDEPLAREGIRLLLKDDADVELVAEAANGKDALSAIRGKKPDLVFLDVQMPEMDGFEVLRSLERPLPAVIFTTAYDRYALKAFEVHALDYLLKPFDDERFREALGRAKTTLKLARVSELSQRLISLLDQEQKPAIATKPETPKEYLSRLAIKDVGRVVFLNIEEVDWIEAADYYVQLHAGPKTYLHRETMQSLEAQLDPRRFLRIHRSAIVNCSRVKELRSHGRRDLSVVLTGGAELRVARSYRDKLESLL